MSEVAIHHVGNRRIPFAFAVHHHAEQAATTLVLVAIKHLHSKEVVGRGCYVDVEDDERYARVITWLNRLIIIGAGAKHTCAADGEYDGEHQKEFLHNKHNILLFIYMTVSAPDVTRMS